MAVLLIPFMVIIAMIIEGGNILWRHQIAVKAVRDSTRYISRAPLLFDDACGLDGAILADTVAAAKVLGVSGSLDGGPPLVPNWTTANLQVPAPVILTADPCVPLVQSVVTVDLPLPFAPIFQLVDPNQAATISFSVADQARWIGE